MSLIDSDCDAKSEATPSLEQRAFNEGHNACMRLCALALVEMPAAAVVEFLKGVIVTAAAGLSEQVGHDKACEALHASEVAIRMARNARVEKAN